MKIGVWVTDHEISYTVGKAIYDSLKPIFPDTELCWTVPKEHLKAIADINIGYGILRNMDDVWKKSVADNKPYFIVDRGYWKPGHYDGYYRVSLRGTQQTTGLDKLEPDYARWDALGIEILPEKKRDMKYPDPYRVYCPPTEYVKSFFDLGEVYNPIECGEDWVMKWRDKYSGPAPLQEDLDICEQLITFNSSVGWEALRQGIPVISDTEHSIVGAYQKLIDKPLHLDYDARRELFAVMSSLQLTLDEMKSGMLWPLLSRLLSTSDSTHEKR